jgi:acetoacetyl-CoA synthetase
MSTPQASRMRLYRDWLAASRDLSFQNYEDMWRWSVTDLDAFWQSIWDYDHLSSPTPHEGVLAHESMPGARWFPGAQVNYARQVFAHVERAAAAGVAAIICEDEAGWVTEIGWAELARRVSAFAVGLRSLGVERGDRIAAVMPNRAETVIAFLGAASIGAIWSLCSPEMGVRAVTDRFRQISPRILIVADGVRHAGIVVDRSAETRALIEGLPSLQGVIVHKSGLDVGAIDSDLTFEAIVARRDDEVERFEPEWLPFDHPLWIVYSSGTTGLPKAIVHSHGGILLSAYASAKHLDLGASYAQDTAGERFHWYSSTGWVMWNGQVAGLLYGTTICIFDGNPGGARDAPDWTTLWRFAARHRVTWFGAGAAFYAKSMQVGIDLAACGDLSAVRALGATGSPLPESVQLWGTAAFAAIGTPDIWWCNVSGGTDLCASFVTGNRDLPQQPGRLQCRQLGSAVEAWDDDGRALLGQVGDLVCTRPIPSMPLFFWNDADGERYRGSYFEKFPGVWRHGDWISIADDGSCVIYGRSDATINRHGLRLGTSEIYAAVEELPEVVDSMVIDLEHLGRQSWMALFVALRDDVILDDALQSRMKSAIRASVSPRFVPDAIYHVPDIPRTLSGKKQEVPVKKLFLGHPAEGLFNREAMANPDCLGWYIRLAAELPA